ncbi:helix-turn-helix domain-containing protein [Paraburkholderia phytofirmans]|nr:LysR family transcriptional regulator [Paraburkholderia phytofirmans]
MPLTRVTIRQFEAFLAIVDLHSIGAAAERLRRSREPSGW